MNFKIKRDDKNLRYLLKETETAIRTMSRDKRAIHLFDVGHVPDGTKYVCLITIAPEERIMQLAQAIDPQATPDTIRETEPLT